MKFYSVFVIFVAFCKVESILRDHRSKVLQKAFVNIMEALRKQNYLMTVVVGEFFSDQIDAVSRAFTMDHPHVVARFNDTKKFNLNSSAIVLLDTTESVKMFNKRTIIPLTFSMQQQILILSRWNFRQSSEDLDFKKRVENHSIRVLRRRRKKNDSSADFRLVYDKQVWRGIASRSEQIR